MQDRDRTRNGHRRRFGGLLAVALGGVLLVALLGFARGSVRADRVTLTIDRAKVVGVSHLRLGVTHTQYTADSWNNPAAVSRARGFLSHAAVFQNQHIMGWGARNPEATPGQYDFGSLDARVALMRATGATPVITLCCAPDWMKGGQPGATDWSKLAEAPLPSHFAGLRGALRGGRQALSQRPLLPGLERAQGLLAPWRAPLRLRGLHRALQPGLRRRQGGAPGREDRRPLPRDLVLVAAGVDELAQPGRGAYGSLDERPLDVIMYWLAHKHGADFITLDAGTDNKDGGSVGAYTGAQKFADVAAWLRKLPAAQYPGAGTLPLWWAEWKVETSPVSHDLQYLTSIMASGLATTLRSGASVALIWGAQGDAGGLANPVGLFTDTKSSSGGAPTPLVDVMQGLRTMFPPGTRLVDASTSSREVDVLASARHVMLVNQSPHAKSVRLGGKRFQLGRYGVLFARVS